MLRLQGAPGSRLSRYPRTGLWRERGVRMVMADRPGYGRSTRHPGHGLASVADDLAQLLDHLGLEQVPVIGISGGGPYALALAERHPERVRRVAVVVGAAPLEEAEVDLLIGANAEVRRRVRRGGWPDVFEFLQGMRSEVLKDPLAAFRAVMQDAPAADHAVMADPEWQAVMSEGFREALRPGAEGWTDESQLLFGAWDLTPEDIQVDVTWWHGRHDANAPLAAAQRLARRLRSCELRVWEAAGHLEVYHREPEVLADVLQG
ncbi:alpha/beta fold hydrolase [Pedococcus sp. NPDC057267]|uniref:alpha/beta fold hydrolase n=1 Tax=Pedococcus sp. NPDC057267 TaxID=3346077 RepID=UPI003638F8DE